MKELEQLKKWAMKRTKEAKESYIQANGTIGEAYASGKVSAFGEVFDKIERMQREQPCEKNTNDKKDKETIEWAYKELAYIYNNHPLYAALHSEAYTYMPQLKSIFEGMPE
jgi:hypothetical protein